MASRNRMTEAARAALIEAYKAWQPDSGISAEELANQHGVTRSAMYAILKDEQIPLKTGMRRGENGIHRAEPLMSEMSKVLATVLLDQNHDLKNRVLQLEVENAALRAQLTVSREGVSFSEQR